MTYLHVHGFNVTCNAATYSRHLTPQKFHQSQANAGTSPKMTKDRPQLLEKLATDLSSFRQAARFNTSTEATARQASR